MPPLITDTAHYTTVLDFVMKDTKYTLWIGTADIKVHDVGLSQYGSLTIRQHRCATFLHPVPYFATVTISNNYYLCILLSEDENHS